MENINSKSYEVVVLGGGPAGCATGLALARYGVSNILIVESGRYETTRVGESIPPDTRKLLNNLGVWQAFGQEAHEPCLGSCSAWGNDTLGYNDFLLNPLGHGWHLDRSRFDNFLAEMAMQNGITVSLHTKFLECHPAGSEGYTIGLQKKGENTIRNIDARLVVDATGMRSGLARRLGAKKRILDRLICVYGSFEYSASHDFSKLTVLEATEYGWWYAARLPNNILAVAIASDPETVKQGGFRKVSNWLARLNDTSHLAGMVTGHPFKQDSLLTYPALSFMLDRVAGDNWLAVGDAASAYDPISSQGIYKALSDGLSAAEVIVARLAGNLNAFDNYQSRIASEFNNYLDTRNVFYAMEKRWPSSLFWSRRQVRMALPYGQK